MDRSVQRNALLRFVDVATIAYFLCLSTIVLFFHRGLRLWGLYIAGHFLIIGLILGLRWWTRGAISGVIVFLRRWYPATLFTFMYKEATGPLLHLVFPGEFDQILIDIDRWIFGTHPTVWLERIITPWLTEYLQASYSMYYFLIPIGGGILYFQKRPKGFEDMLLGVAIAFYISYLFFIFFPAAGPRFVLASQQTVELRGLWLTATLRSIIGDVANRGGCFPSSHVAVVVVILLFLRQHARRAYYPFLIVVLSLIAGTVYGRYHYVVDVVAGAALAAVCAHVSPRLNEWWNSKNRKKPVDVKQKG